MSIHIVLVHPEIPHNTGAIGRTCVALGYDLALIRPIRFALDDAHIRRCGLDYWPYLKLSVHENWEAFLADAKPERLFFLSTKGSKSLYETSFRDGDTLVFGCESRGLPSELYERYSNDLFRIPMPGEHSRSLNLSNAVAIAAYEAYRQLNPVSPEQP